MNITSVSATSARPPRSATDQGTIAASAGAGPVSGSPATGPVGDTVQISGESLVLSRLFHGTPVSYTPGDASLASGTIYGFLTASDRATLASMYEYAQAQGTDLLEVDHVAFDLGVYRSTPANIRATTPAAGYDQDGNLLPVAFSAPDEAVATRILTSKAIKDSALPETFLRYELNPGMGGKAASFAFLEQYVYATSTSGSDGATDPAAVLAPRSPEYFRELQVADGSVYSPDQLKRLMAGLPAEPVRPSGDADDTDPAADLAATLARSRADLIAELYDVLTKGRRDDDRRARPIDELAYELLAQRTDTTDA